MKYLLLILVFCIPAVLRAEIDRTQFGSAYESFLQNPHAKPASEQIAKHENTIFIFVAGLYGKNIPGYFTHSVGTVQKMYLPGQTGNYPRTFLITPSSTRSMRDNTEFVEREIGKIISDAPPYSHFNIEGHSMGAVESWAALMRHPEWLEEKVTGAILIQGPFGGTPLTSFVLGTREVSEIEPFWENPLLHLAGRYLVRRYRKSPKVAPTLLSMTPTEASKFISETESEYGFKVGAEQREKFLFLNTSVPLFEGFWKYIPLPTQASVMNACGNALHKLLAGPGDSLVPLASQTPPGWGNRALNIGDNIHHLKTVVDPRTSGAIAKSKFSIGN